MYPAGSLAAVRRVSGSTPTMLLAPFPPTRTALGNNWVDPSAAGCEAATDAAAARAADGCVSGGDSAAMVDPRSALDATAAAPAASAMAAAHPSVASLRCAQKTVLSVALAKPAAPVAAAAAVPLALTSAINAGGADNSA